MCRKLEPQAVPVAFKMSLLMQNVKAIRVQPLTTAREYLYSMTKEATKNRENELNFSRNASSIIF